MAKMNFTPADEMRDELWGPIGTPERDAMESQLKEDIQAYFVGEAIKKETSQTKPHTRGIRWKSRSKTLPNMQVGEWEKLHHPFHHEQSIQSIRHCHRHSRSWNRRQSRIVV